MCKEKLNKSEIRLYYFYYYRTEKMYYYPELFIDNFVNNIPTYISKWVNKSILK